MVNVYILHSGTGVNSDIWNFHPDVPGELTQKDINVHSHNDISGGYVPLNQGTNKKNGKHGQRAHDMKWNTYVESDHHVQG